MKLMGLKRRTDETRERLLSARPYRLSDLAPPQSVIQDVLCIHKQPMKPACVGHACTEVDESVTAVRKSAIQAWNGARRRQGSQYDPSVGTESIYVIEDWMNRGFAEYVEGEDTESMFEDVGNTTVEQDVSAIDDVLSFKADHKVLTTQRVEQACDALTRKAYGIVHGGAVNDNFMNLQLNDIISPSCVTGNAGHERRIFGWDNALGLFMEQQSWDLNFAGIILPVGYMVPNDFIYNGVQYKAGRLKSQAILPGAAWLEPASYLLSWDSDSLEVLL